ncbi:MAG: hypothetical protein JSS60_04930 [Verrucomicrobia bacterium]|nr:hypothetical protein [Verrucomicrobiota bacterium]
MVATTNQLVRSYPLDWNLEMVHSQEEKSTIILQRCIRGFLAAKKLAQGDPQTLMPQVNQWQDRTVACYPRVPLLPYAPSQEKGDSLVQGLPTQVAQSVRKFLSSPALKHIDFQNFSEAFERSLFRTMQFIMSLPPKDQGYVIVVDDPEKSNSWMVSLALKLLSAHPPIDVVHRDDLSSVVKNKNIRHLILLDDASYSGKQIASTLDLSVFSLLDYFPHVKAVHTVVPFMTSQAEDKISHSISTYYSNDRIPVPSYFVSTEATMPMIKELPHLPVGVTEEDVSNFYLFLQKQYDIKPEVAELLTLTFLDHKIADAMSTPDKLIKAVVGPVVPPYKREFDEVVDSVALSTRSSLRIDQIPEIGSQLQEQFAIIERGNKMYVCTKLECEELVIHRNGAQISLKSMEMFEILDGDILETEETKLKLSGNKIELT